MSRGSHEAVDNEPGDNKHDEDTDDNPDDSGTHCVCVRGVVRVYF